MKDDPNHNHDPATLIMDKPSLLDDLAALTGIEIPGEHAAAVRGHLATAARMAALLYNAPLNDHALDGAAVFTPAEPDHD